MVNFRGLGIYVPRKSTAQFRSYSASRSSLIRIVPTTTRLVTKHSTNQSSGTKSAPPSWQAAGL